MARFLALVAAAYLASNVAFAFAYMALGPAALTGALEASASIFPRAFFFSVHTLSTVGYGSIVPASVAANALMTIESLFGLFGIALNDGSRLRPLRSAHGKDPVQQKRSCRTLSRRARSDVPHRKPTKYPNHRARSHRRLQSHGGRKTGSASAASTRWRSSGRKSFSSLLPGPSSIPSIETARSMT